MANIELLEKIYGIVLANRERWSQGSWFRHLYTEENECKTAFCFAGWTAASFGHRPPSNNCDTWMVGDMFVSSWAERELELTWEQAEVLFSSANSLEDIRKIIDAIKEDGNIGMRSLIHKLD